MSVIESENNSVNSISSFQVGVVLPLYNQREEYIHECLASLEAQSFRNYKLVIVIDGANESTVNAFNKAIKQLSVPHRIVQRAENRGIAYSLNEGFSHLEDCEFFTWVSSDNRYCSDFLAELSNAMLSEPDDVVLVYSLFDLIDEYGRKISTETSRQEMIPFMHRPKDHIIQNCFIGASFLFRKDAFLKAGGYNAEYEKAEDYELWIRLLKIGQIKFVKKVLMEYRINGKFSYSTTVPKEELTYVSVQAGAYHRVLDNDIPKVTVLLCMFNQDKYVTQAIKSVMDQTFSNFHLVLLDDGSKDNTWYYANKFYDPRIIPIRFSYNRGKAQILNIGLRYAFGEYVLELDGDDWLEPNALEVMVREMNLQSTEVGLAYANRKIWFERNGSIVEGPVYKGINYKDKYEVLTMMNTHCPRMYRKSALEAIGGWPVEIIPGYRLMAEDYYISLRLCEKFKFHWIDQTLYNQLRHDKNITTVEARQCQQQLIRMVEETLKRWGDYYNPVFYYDQNWISKVDLIPKPS